MHGENRDLMVLAQLFDGLDVLRDRIDRDHQFDTVESQRCREFERAGSRLRIDRRGRQTNLRN